MCGSEWYRYFDKICLFYLLVSLETRGRHPIQKWIKDEHLHPIKWNQWNALFYETQPIGIKYWGALSQLSQCLTWLSGKVCNKQAYMSQQYMTSCNQSVPVLICLCSLHSFIVSGGCVEQPKTCCRWTAEDLDPFDLGSSLTCVKMGKRIP